MDILVEQFGDTLTKLSLPDDFDDEEVKKLGKFRNLEFLWLYTWPGWEEEDPQKIFDHEANLRGMYPDLKINSGYRYLYEGPRIGKSFVSCKPKYIFNQSYQFRPRNVKRKKKEHNPNPPKKFKLDKK